MQAIDPYNVHEIQVDVTSYCNSFCGACVRNVKGGPVSPYVKLQHIDEKVWQKICDFAAETNTAKISFNGNFGDISSHPKFIQMLEYLYSVAGEKVRLNIHTNGGARSENFWRDLAIVTQKIPASVVTFSVDGLEDTNHIYRRGVNFDAVMKNAEAYIGAGGHARWRMIVFDHNIHQIEEASARAKEMGFIEFVLNRSFATHIPVIEYRGMPAGEITAPKPLHVERLRESVEWFDDSIPYIEVVTSEQMKRKSPCPWTHYSRIQINQMGEVWPCCYFSMHTGRPDDRRRFGWLDEKIELYGEDFNNLNHHSMLEVLSNTFFQKDLRKNFKRRLLPLCSEKCGI